MASYRLDERRAALTMEAEMARVRKAAKLAHERLGRERKIASHARSEAEKAQPAVDLVQHELDRARKEAHRAFRLPQMAVPRAKKHAQKMSLFALY